MKCRFPKTLLTLLITVVLQQVYAHVYTHDTQNVTVSDATFGHERHTVNVTVTDATTCHKKHTFTVRLCQMKPLITWGTRSQCDCVRCDCWSRHAITVWLCQMRLLVTWGTRSQCDCVRCDCWLHEARNHSVTVSGATAGRGTQSPCDCSRRMHGCTLLSNKWQMARSIVRLPLQSQLFYGDRRHHLPFSHSCPKDIELLVKLFQKIKNLCESRLLISFMWGYTNLWQSESFVELRTL